MNSKPSRVEGVLVEVVEGKAVVVVGLKLVVVGGLMEVVEGKAVVVVGLKLVEVVGGLVEVKKGGLVEEEYRLGMGVVVNFFLLLLRMFSLNFDMSILSTAFCSRCGFLIVSLGLKDFVCIIMLFIYLRRHC